MSARKRVPPGSAAMSTREGLRSLFVDRKHRVPRLWSNEEIRRFAPLFTGAVVNVSGWTDTDKDGGRYADYFAGATSYTITNYEAEARGFQGNRDEIFLDLTQPLPDALRDRFDVVFNHTVLEHIYEVQTAFSNLCAMTRDIVMLVVPFLQPMHADYGDYWRFTPLTVKRMFEDNGLTLVYLSFNNHPGTAVYVFAIGSKHPDRWRQAIPYEFSYTAPSPPLDRREPYIGCHALPNRGYALRSRLTDWVRAAKRTR